MSKRARFRLGLGAAVAIVALSVAGVVVTPTFQHAYAGNSANAPARASGGSVSPASSTSAGTMSAADKAFTDLTTTWHRTRAAEQIALVPQLTKCKPVWIGGGGGGALKISALNTLGEGGSTAYTAAAVNQFTQSLFMIPKTGKWGMSFRAVYAAPVNGRYGRIGMINAANSHLVSLSNLFTSDATHLVLEIIGGATTSVVASGTGSTIVDATPIDVTMTFNSTTITVQVAGATVATTTTLTNLADEPMGLFSQGAQTQDAYVLDAVYCYVAP